MDGFSVLLCPVVLNRFLIRFIRTGMQQFPAGFFTIFHPNLIGFHYIACSGFYSGFAGTIRQIGIINVFDFGWSS